MNELERLVWQIIKEFEGMEPEDIRAIHREWLEKMAEDGIMLSYGVVALLNEVCNYCCEKAEVLQV